MVDTPELISKLEQLDNKHGYRLTYEQASQKLLPVVDKIIEKEEELLPYLHELIKYEETWSCLFALIALKGIKSPSSVPHLIDFLNRINDNDYWEFGEEAMFALNAIGKPAIDLLLKTIDDMLKSKQFDYYLVGALTEIKDKRVYSCMVSVLEDYLNNPKNYAEWFSIDAWCFDFTEQENKEVLPLLKKVLAMPNLTDHERIEMKDTIEKLEDPEEWERKFNQDMLKFSKKIKIGRNEPCSCGSGKKYKKCCMNKNIPEKEDLEQDFWEESSFAETLSSCDLNTKMRTFHMKHDEEMNYNCKKCNNKISAHNKDWHARLCDTCFDKKVYKNS